MANCNKGKGKGKVRKNSTTKNSKSNLAKGGKKYKISYQKSRSKKSKAAEAKKRHDRVMRATGRGSLIKKSK